MRAYMAYSRDLGSEEAAFLVFADSARAAKKLVWPEARYTLVEDWTDLAVRWIKRSADVFPLADQQKLSSGIPHVVDEPLVCENCELWGAGINKDGKCNLCGQPAGQALMDAFMQYEGRS